MTRARRVYVDTEDRSESLWTRSVNHTSHLHNNMNPNSIHKSCNGWPRMWFMAKQDIKPGNKICLRTFGWRIINDEQE
jgi:hypothetical protein